jgi:cytosine/adenosine deaminase-related metal-dependent hydrolase
LLLNNVLVARRFFDEPLLGELAPGAPADVIVVDSQPPTPVSAMNLMSHLIYGASEAPVRHTIARGRVLLEDFVHRTVNPEELAARARELTPGLWQRFAALKCGTNFLGQ